MKSTPNPTPDFTADPHWGKGGRYVFDPATGLRTPVPEPADAAPEPATDAAGAAPTDQPALKKGK